MNSKQSKATIWPRAWRLVLQRLLPGACALCGGDSDDALCAGCAAQFFGAAAHRPRCPRCANPLTPGSTPGSGPATGHELNGQSGSEPTFGHELNRHPGSVLTIAHGLGSSRAAVAVAGAAAAQLCGACLADPPAFDRTLVAADYAMPVDQLVLQLKFGHRLALAPLLARLLRDTVLTQPDFVLPALLCPVPLGPHRLAERGYNQALEIARPLARSLGVTLDARLISRVHDTAAQSSVAPDQRRQNIAGAFAIRDAALVQGRHIGIVDDVMTSGGTLNELAAVLKRHGAARVSNLVFARTPPH